MPFQEFSLWQRGVRGGCCSLYCRDSGPRPAPFHFCPYLWSSSLMVAHPPAGSPVVRGSALAFAVFTVKPF